jgi:dephospho-CoA kinase
MTTQTHRVALGGGMGAGKTTLARHLYSYYRASLAGSLKELAHLFLGGVPIDKGKHRAFLQRFNIARMPEWEFVRYARRPIEQERCAQLLATALEGKDDLFGPLHAPGTGEARYHACKRLRDALYGEKAYAEGFGEPDYWVKRLVRALDAIEGPIVIDDVRRINEAEGLRQAGFAIIQVQTPERVRAQRIFDRDGHFDPKWLAHESESEWPRIRYDATIPGVGPIEDNAEALIKLVGSLSGQRAGR